MDNDFSHYKAFRVVSNGGECGHCNPFVYDIVCSVSAGSITIAQVESEEMGEWICAALNARQKLFGE